MASGFTNKALAETFKNNIDWENDTLKIMLVDSTYQFDPEKYAVDQDDDGVYDAHHHEISVTNYTGGYGGAGRKTATVAISEDDTNDQMDITLSDLTWTALGAGATIGMALLIKEITDDQSSLVLYAFDLTDMPTMGGDVTLDFAPTGQVSINSVGT